jgi:sugar-specific transcriptional regulator TrmB
LSLNKIENDLVNEVRLSQTEAKVFLLVTTKGKMSADKISQELGISQEESLAAAKKLVERGGFIDISPTEFEAMHPRFTAVNMYRKMCQRENIEFKKNLTVDNIGVALEDHYDRARTTKD